MVFPVGKHVNSPFTGIIQARGSNIDCREQKCSPLSVWRGKVKEPS